MNRARPLAVTSPAPRWHRGLGQSPAIDHTPSGGEGLDIYQLDYILHEPAESEGWMYLAEVPTLQGMGDTPEETSKNLLAVSQSTI